jgi:hypothetical protein
VLVPEPEAQRPLGEPARSDPMSIRAIPCSLVGPLSANISVLHGAPSTFAFGRCLVQISVDTPAIMIEAFHDFPQFLR